MSRIKPSQYVPNLDRSDKSFQFTADFLAAIFTWGGVGWVADRYLGTEPLLMVIGFIVGNMAGIYLLYIRSGDGQPSTPRRSSDAPSEDSGRTDTDSPDAQSPTDIEQR